MPQSVAGRNTGETRYRVVTLLSLIAAIAQVTLGGVVRVTGSGDACPDWPLCHGQIIPPLDYHIWLEFTHRLAATALGVLVVASLVLAWRHMRTSRAAVAATAASTGLVVGAAVLGGVTVLSELSWWTRLIHLGLAELTVAGLAIAWLAGHPEDRSGVPKNLDITVSRENRMTTWMGAGGLLLVILYGSYMVGIGYGSICTSWPLCVGSRIPGGMGFTVNMGHRYIVAIVAVLVLRACYVAWKQGAIFRQLRWMAALTAWFLVLEIGVGAFTALLGSSPLMASLHLTFATLSLVSMVLMATVQLDPVTFHVRTPRSQISG